VFDNGVDGMPSVEDIINDQQAVFLTTVFDEVVHAMNANVARSPVDARIGRRSYRYVVSLDAVIGEQFLHCNAHWSAAAPDSNDNRRPKTVPDYIGPK
jgi:hypothetical protein